MPHVSILPHPRDARKAAGLTRSALARLVQCHRCTVIAAERDGKYPRTHHLRAAYLKALGYTEIPDAVTRVLEETP